MGSEIWRRQKQIRCDFDKPSVGIKPLNLKSRPAHLAASLIARVPVSRLATSAVSHFGICGHAATTLLFRHRNCAFGFTSVDMWPYLSEPGLGRFHKQSIFEPGEPQCAMPAAFLFFNTHYLKLMISPLYLSFAWRTMEKMRDL